MDAGREVILDTTFSILLISALQTSSLQHAGLHCYMKGKAVDHILYTVCYSASTVPQMYVTYSIALTVLHTVEVCIFQRNQRFLIGRQIRAVNQHTIINIQDTDLSCN